MQRDFQRGLLRKEGVLPRPARTSRGYRRYPPESVARVLLVQRALVVGFTLDELARVFRQRDRGDPPCRAVRDLVSARLADLEARLAQLTALRRELRQLLATWDSNVGGDGGGPTGAPAALAHRQRRDCTGTAGATAPAARRLNCQHLHSEIASLNRDACRARLHRALRTARRGRD